MEVLKQGLKVMDSTAISLCKDNNLPIIIFNLNQRGNIRESGHRREDRIAGERVELRPPGLAIEDGLSARPAGSATLGLPV